MPTIYTAKKKAGGSPSHTKIAESFRPGIDFGLAIVQSDAFGFGICVLYLYASHKAQASFLTGHL